MVYNFAFPGATAEDDLEDELAQFYKMFPKKASPKESPPLDSTKITYFVFLGINDWGRSASDELDSVAETVLDVVHDLYVKAGARNFVFIYVPTVNCSPQAADSASSDEVRLNSAKEATMFLLLSQQMLAAVLEDPLEFDSSDDDVTTEGGGIWADDLHLTSDVHDIYAEQILTSILPPR
ncbi:hypothetical protein BC835DRAFT_1418189 [Cytidiella melzeri]|nr:hypothetical protein BC835DRAFT_1418189 [Cytidiella melzeri]